MQLTYLICRPITQTGQRVSPSDMQAYRVGHEFKAPCCLGANDTVEDYYTESAIYLAPNGIYAGEYVAGCAGARCGYLSKCNYYSTHFLVQLLNIPFISCSLY